MGEPEPSDGGLRAKAEAFRALQEIIERLRGPGGCPWDRAQTLETMAPNVLEEACEVVDAVRDGGGSPAPGVREELGDLLMNVLLAARIAEEAGAFGIREVSEEIAAKLIRRHPHVFGGERATGVDDVLRRWTAIKVQEKKDGGGEAGGRPSRLGRIPRSLPGLLAAVKVGERAGAVGFDWPDAPSVLAKVEEELGELKRALADAGGRAPAGPASPEVRHEIGDLLFAVASLARKAGVDPEDALRSALGRFERRFRHIEERIDVSRATLDEMEALWQAAKEEER